MRLRSLLVLGAITAAPAQALPLQLHAARLAVKITRKPAAFVHSTSARFAWTHTGTVRSVTCKLDALPARSCSKGTITYRNLTAGQHSFVLRVRGASTLRILTRKWLIDLDNPLAPTSVLGGSASWGTAAHTLTASGGSDATSGLKGYQYRSSSDGGTTWSTPVTQNPVDYNAAGSHVVQFRSVDKAGNVSDWAPAVAGARHDRADRSHRPRPAHPGRRLAGLAGRAVGRRDRHRGRRRRRLRIRPPVLPRLHRRRRHLVGRDRPARWSRSATRAPRWCGSARTMSPATARPGPRRPSASTAPRRPIRRRQRRLAGLAERDLAAPGRLRLDRFAGLRRGLHRAADLDRRRRHLVGHGARQRPHGHRRGRDAGAASAPSTRPAWPATGWSGHRPHRSHQPHQADAGRRRWRLAERRAGVGDRLRLRATPVGSGFGYQYETALDGGAWSAPALGAGRRHHRRGHHHGALPRAGRRRQPLRLGAVDRRDRPHGARRPGPDRRLAVVAVGRLGAGDRLGLDRRRIRPGRLPVSRPRPTAAPTGRRRRSGATATVSAEGETLVQFQALDNAGIGSSWVQTQVRIDRTLPTAPYRQRRQPRLAGRRAGVGDRLRLDRRRRLRPGRLRAPHLDQRRGDLVGRGRRRSLQVVASEGQTLVQVRSLDDAGNASAWTPARPPPAAPSGSTCSDPTAPSLAGGSASLEEHGPGVGDRLRLDRRRQRHRPLRVSDLDQRRRLAAGHAQRRPHRLGVGGR